VKGLFEAAEELPQAGEDEAFGELGLRRQRQREARPAVEAT
jgi:hypothetical protein